MPASRRRSSSRSVQLQTIVEVARSGALPNARLGLRSGYRRSPAPASRGCCRNSSVGATGSKGALVASGPVPVLGEGVFVLGAGRDGRGRTGVVDEDEVEGPSEEDCAARSGSSSPMTGNGGWWTTGLAQLLGLQERVGGRGRRTCSVAGGCSWNGIADTTRARSSPSRTCNGRIAGCSSSSITLLEYVHRVRRFRPGARSEESWEEQQPRMGRPRLPARPPAPTTPCSACSRAWVQACHQRCRRQDPRRERKSGAPAPMPAGPCGCLFLDRGVLTVQEGSLVDVVAVGV